MCSWHCVNKRVGNLLIALLGCMIRNKVIVCHNNNYVTVHAKTSLVRNKIKIHFLAQLITTHISYLHSMSPMVRLNWSGFLGGGFTTL